jgi:hypothetical protein
MLTSRVKPIGLSRVNITRHIAKALRAMGGGGHQATGREAYHTEIQTHMRSAE